MMLQTLCTGCARAPDEFIFNMLRRSLQRAAALRLRFQPKASSWLGLDATRTIEVRSSHFLHDIMLYYILYYPGIVSNNAEKASSD